MTEQNGVGRSNAPTRKVVEPTTLLPCPFCGGKARIKHLITAGVRTHSRAECTRCHVKTDYYIHEFGERNVIAAWNRRADDD